MMQNKDQAIAEIFRLMQQYGIGIDDLKAQERLVNPPVQSEAIKKFLGFVGAIFILCGICVYISQNWMMLNSAARIIITLGPGIVLYALSAMMVSNPRYQRIVTPLFLGGILFEVIGLYVAIAELFPGGKDGRYATLVVCGTLALQQIFTLSNYKGGEIVLALICFVGVFCATTFDLMSVRADYNALVIGVSLFLIAYALTSSIYISLTPVLYLVAGSLILFSSFDLLQDTRIEFVYVAISVFFMYLSTLVLSRTLLFISSLALIAYISYFSSKHFVNSIGWPITLILCGIFILILSVIAVNIGRSIKQ